MPNLFTRQFWQDTAERTISSAAQGFIVGGGLVGVAAATNQVTLNGFPWLGALGGAGGMAVLTIAKCLAVIDVGDKGTASLAKIATTP